MLSIDEYYQMCGKCSRVSEQLALKRGITDPVDRSEAVFFVGQLLRVQQIMRGGTDVSVDDGDLLTVVRDMPILEKLYGNLTYTDYCTRQLEIILNAVDKGGQYVPKAELFFRETTEAYSVAASFLNRH